jgi:hypothetical protein
MIRFGSEAVSELEDAIDWYLSRSIRVAGRFHQTFSSVLSNFEADRFRYSARITYGLHLRSIRRKPTHGLP